MVDFEVMLGLMWPHCNMEIGMDVLLCKRIMVKSKNCIQQEVFGIIDNVCQHIHYEQVADTNFELVTLSEGNKKITSRKVKSSTRKRGRERC